MDFNCKHDGCSFSGKISVITSHQRGCEHREVHCPDKDCPDKIEEKDLFQHFDIKHYEIKRFAGETGHFLSPNDKTVRDKHRRIVSIRKDGRTYLLHLDKMNFEYNSWVQVLGGPEVNGQYRVKATFGKQDKNCLVLLGKPYPLDTPRQYILEDPEVVKISNNLVNRLLVPGDGNELFEMLWVKYDLLKIEN